MGKTKAKQKPEQEDQDIKISRQWKDIIQKRVSSLFRDSTLEFYGIDVPKIKELITVSLPVIVVRDSYTDQVFLLEDGTYLHIGFQAITDGDLIRHLEYDMRLYVLGKGKHKVITIIVYTADVDETPEPLEIGSAVYSPGAVLMQKYDGDAIYAELETKVKAGEQLTDLDMVKMAFLPLMKTKKPRADITVNTVNLAKTIPDPDKRDVCIAAAFAYGSKMLKGMELKKLKEALQMTELAGMLVEDAVREERIALAKKMLIDGKDVNEIVKYSNLTFEEIEDLR